MTIEDLKTFDREFLNNRKIILSLNSVLMNFTYIILFFVDIIILLMSILIFLKVNLSIYSLICFVSFFILLIILIETYKKKTLRVLN